MSVASAPRNWLPLMLPLMLLGLVIGVICIPLNEIDSISDHVLTDVFALGEGLGWFVLLPLVAMPLVLKLQQRWLRPGAGSGIPQADACIEDPELAPKLLGLRPLLSRLVLWSIAAGCLLPIGREGPVVFVGASAVWLMRRSLKGPMREIGMPVLLAAAGGAGLAAGFNTPLVAILFSAEDLLKRFNLPLVWSSLPVALLASLVAAYGGQPTFAYGELPMLVEGPMQMLLALPVGVACGLIGALFSALLLTFTRKVAPLAVRYPLPMGLFLGAGMLLMALGNPRVLGEGSAVLHDIINNAGEVPLWSGLAVIAERVFGPILVLGSGIPGGLIDPALAFGGVTGAVVMPWFSGHTGLIGMICGMAGGLAGATQLPIFAALFTLKLTGALDCVPGLLVTSAMAAYISRWLQPKPIYHALTEMFLGKDDLPEEPELPKA
mgnify:FL=1